MNNLSFSINDSAKIHEITLIGALTLMDALEFKTMLNEKEFNGEEVIIDLLQVDAIDLTGLNALLMAKIKLEKGGKLIKLYISNDHPIHSLLHLTKFTNQFTMVAS